MSTYFIFGLGVVSAIVIIVIIALVVLVLKLKTKLEETAESVRTLQSDLSSVFDDISLRIDSIERDCNSYTDSRFDKIQK